MATFTRTFGSQQVRAKKSTAAVSPATSETPPPDAVVLKVATWNVDGLCQEHMLQRSRESARILLSTRADVIFLQEVVAESQRVFERALGQAYVIAGGAGGSAGGSYWTLAFVRRDHRVVRARRDAFAGEGRSTMGRDLLLVDIAVAKSPATAAAAAAGGAAAGGGGGSGGSVVVVRCITSHLESTKPMASQRIKQLEQIAGAMHAFDGPAVCGGDFNMRDVEQHEALKARPMTDACVRRWAVWSHPPTW